MKREWKVFPTGDIPPHAAGLYATMNPMGEIAVNGWTHKRMGEPEAVHLLYDAANNTIGLKPTSRSFKNACLVRRRNSRTGGRVVAANRLLREASLALPETVEFRNIEIDIDGILVLDLRQTRLSPRALAFKSRRSKPLPG
jgi:hypothetical protein